MFVDLDRITKKLVIYILLDPPMYPPDSNNVLYSDSDNILFNDSNDVLYSE